MINKIKLKNFQSHTNTELDFCDGVNVIVGQSDSGKTAILRAINLIINNKPNGVGYITKNEKVCNIEAEIDGNVIVRNRSDELNEFIVNDKKLVAFGQNSPEEINDLLKFTDLNIQKQMDSPFFLSFTPGEAAKYLNKIVNLDIIDRVLFNIENMKRGFKNKCDAKSEQLENINKKIKSLNWVDSCCEQIDKISFKEDNLQKLEKNISTLKAIGDDILDTKERLENFELIIKHKDEVVQLLCDINVVENKEDEIEELKEITTSFWSVEKQIEEKGLYDISDLKIIQNCLDLILRYDKLCEKLDSLSMLKTTVVRTEKQIIFINQELKELNSKAKELLNELGLCPLCGSSVNSGALPF